LIFIPVALDLPSSSYGKEPTSPSPSDVAVVLWLSPLLQRLAALRQTAKSFGSGQLQARVTPGVFSYITDIELEFNRMAQRIQTLVEDNKLLSSSVSHDLRTPLARLRFGIDTLADCADPTMHQKYLSRINHDLDEMERLVHSLLRFARLDHHLTSANKAPVNLCDLTQECMLQYQEESIALAYHCTEATACLHSNPEYLAMLINNLLQNAIKHANKRARLSIKATGKTIALAVSDDGPGIPPAQRASVLKPFTRHSATLPVDSGSADNATDSAQRHGEGYGLGLSIVERITQWHDARLSITDCPHLGGALITVTFDSALEHH